MQGIQKNFERFQDSQDGEKKNVSTNINMDLKNQDLMTRCIKKCVIRLNNKLYKSEQIFISFCCLASSYVYFYVMVFGWVNEYKVFCFEFIFLFDMFINFFVEYLPDDGKGQPVRDLRKIAFNYLQNNFIFECIPLIPF